MLMTNFNAMQESQLKLIPFCLTLGPFNRAYDIESFDLDIYRLESFDNNQIQVTYKLSD